MPVCLLSQRHVQIQIFYIFYSFYIFAKPLSIHNFHVPNFHCLKNPCTTNQLYYLDFFLRRNKRMIFCLVTLISIDGLHRLSWSCSSLWKKKRQMILKPNVLSDFFLKEESKWRWRQLQLISLQCIGGVEATGAEMQDWSYQCRIALIQMDVQVGSVRCQLLIQTSI